MMIEEEQDSINEKLKQALKKGTSQEELEALISQRADPNVIKEVHAYSFKPDGTKEVRGTKLPSLDIISEETFSFLLEQGLKLDNVDEIKNALIFSDTLLDNLLSKYKLKPNVFLESLIKHDKDADQILERQKHWIDIATTQYSADISAFCKRFSSDTYCHSVTIPSEDLLKHLLLKGPIINKDKTWLYHLPQYSSEMHNFLLNEGYISLNNYLFHIIRGRVHTYGNAYYKSNVGYTQLQFMVKVFNNHSPSITKGADTSLIDEDSWSSALSEALQNKNNSEAENLLNYIPALVNFENKFNVSPIAVASSSENIEGVKLCIAYSALQMHPSNPCEKIGKELALNGNFPYQFHTPPVQFYNPEEIISAGLLFIIIQGSDTESLVIDIDNSFVEPLKNNNISLLTVGISSVPLQINQIASAIKNAVSNYLEYITRVNVILFTHGHFSDKKPYLHENNHHVIKITNNLYEPTKNLFEFFGKFFEETEFRLLSFSCFGGAILQDAHLLPKDTKTVTLAKDDKSVSSFDTMPIGFSLEKEPLALELEKFPFIFLDKYLIGMSVMNNFPGVFEDGFYYFLDQLAAGKIGKPLLKCEVEFLWQLDFVQIIPKNKVSSAISNIENSQTIQELEDPSNMSKTEIEAELKNHTSSTTQVNNVEDKIPGTKCVVTMQEILLPNEKYEYIEALAETDYYYCLNHPSKNDCSPLPETPILGLSLFFIKALNSTEAQEYCSHHQDYGEL